MPFVDKPLKELYEYMGSTPCPKDFDTFWDARLFELKSHDPAPRLTPADFKSSAAEAYDLYFTGTKGVKVYAKYIKPKNLTGKAPLLLCFHGYSGASGLWSSYLNYVSEGFCVAALDCRGQGGRSDTGSTCGTTFRNMFLRGVDGPAEDMLFVQQYLDLALLARITMSFDETDETRVAAMGGSQGGALTLACAALVPEIKKAAAHHPFLSDFKRVWDMGIVKEGAYNEIDYYFRRFDPRHEREEEFFTKLGYIDIQNLAKRIRAEILMCTGLMDITCPPSTQFAVYNKITSKKDFLIYPEFGHEALADQADIDFEFLRELAK